MTPDEILADMRRRVGFDPSYAQMIFGLAQAIEFLIMAEAAHRDERIGDTARAIQKLARELVEKESVCS